MHGSFGTWPTRRSRSSCDTARGKGVPQPLVEIRARTDDGFAPWDGKTMGELEVRGPWVAASYYNSEGPDDRVHEGRLVPDRRHRDDRRARLHRAHRSRQGSGQVGRRVDQHRGARDRADVSSRRGRSGGHRRAASQVGRAAAGGRGLEDRGRPRRPTISALSSRRISPSGGCPTRSSSRRRSRGPRSGSSRRRRCASGIAITIRR